jgi:hypothetical protein
MKEELHLQVKGGITPSKMVPEDDRQISIW